MCVNMNARPATIPHQIKDFFHNKPSCIDVRGGTVHCLKINTNNRRWRNVIDEQMAVISVNPKTKFQNNLVWKQKTPFHVISFGVGPETMYWGRYVSTNRRGETFKLKYVDDGELSKCLPVGSRNESRSLLEQRWAAAFKSANVTATYEPATLKFPPCPTFPSGKEYTPDVWLPSSSEFVEIKGPKPKPCELEKCRLTCSLGFNIKMFHGGPDSFDCYDFGPEGVLSVKHYDSYYRYLHPAGKRKKRKIHNIGV